MFAFYYRIFVSVLIAGIFLASGPSPSHAQSAQSAVYLELGGNGFIYTINYERFFTPEISARGGLMVFPLSSPRANNESSALVSFVPLTANYFLGDTHRLELGAGPILIGAGGSVNTPTTSESGGGVGLAGTLTLGYRYQPPSGGFVFRIGATPIFGNGFVPWGGISLGYAF